MSDGGLSFTELVERLHPRVVDVEYDCGCKTGRYLAAEGPGGAAFVISCVDHTGYTVTVDPSDPATIERAAERLYEALWDDELVSETWPLLAESRRGRYRRIAAAVLASLSPEPREDPK